MLDLPESASDLGVVKEPEAEAKEEGSEDKLKAPGERVSRCDSWQSSPVVRILVMGEDWGL